jgi:hypothetical protein
VPTQLIHDVFTTHAPTPVAKRAKPFDDALWWILACVLIVIHLAALGVVIWGRMDDYFFTKPLFGCLLISLAINGAACFTGPAPKRVVFNRLGLAAVLLGCATVGPIVNLQHVDPRRWIWLVTGIQAARALWIAPRGAPPLSATQRLAALAALIAYMYVTPRAVGGFWSHQFDQFVINFLVAATVVILVAKRTRLIGSLVMGTATGALVVVVTVAAWAEYYHFTMGIDKVLPMILTAGAGLLIAIVGRIQRPSRATQLHKIDLDYKSSAAVRRLARTLRSRGALIVKEQPGGKYSGELDDARALPVLIEALSSNDLHVRYSAADVLGRIGPPAAPAIDSLWRLVGSDPQPGDRAGEALARIGGEGIAALIELFHSDNSQQRAGAAQALRLAGGDSGAYAAEALADAMSDPDAAVRQHAASSLGELGVTNPIVTAALELAAVDPVLPVRYAARRSLSRLLDRPSPPDL